MERGAHRKNQLVSLLLIYLALVSLFQYPLKAEEKQTLQLGIALPLTGVAADYGVAYRNGFELGLADNPKLKDRLDIHMEDHRFDSKVALSTVRKFDSINKVNLIYVWGFTPSDVVAPIASSLHSPLLLASINPVSKGQKSILNIESSLENLAAPLSDHLRKTPYKRVAIVATQLGALVQSGEILKSAIPAEHLVSNDIFLPEVTDFSSLIARLKNKEVDTVILLLSPEQGEMFVKQGREIGYEPMYLGGNTFNSASFIKLFKDSSKHPLYVDSFLDPEFQSRYESKFKNSSHVTEAARGYFLTILLNHIVKESKTFKAEAIMDVIRTMPPGTSPAGKYKIVDDATFGLHVNFESSLYEIK